MKRKKVMQSYRLLLASLLQRLKTILNICKKSLLKLRSSN